MIAKSNIYFCNSDSSTSIHTYPAQLGSPSVAAGVNRTKSNINTNERKHENSVPVLFALKLRASDSSNS